LCIWPITPAKFPAWLSGRLKAAGLRVEPSALDGLVYHTEGNLLAAAQTVERLALQYGKIDRLLTETEVSGALTDNARFDVYQLVETALMGDLVKTLRILTRLRAEALPPTLLLWAINRELRRLTRIAYGVQQGQSTALLFKAQHVWPKQQAVLQSALRRFPNALYWQKLIQKAQVIDSVIKGVSNGNYWVEFERLLACMAYQPSRGARQ